jgi:hypothetical protein
MVRKFDRAAGAHRLHSTSHQDPCRPVVTRVPCHRHAIR